MGGGGVEGGGSVDTVKEIVDNPLNLFESPYVRVVLRLMCSIQPISH